MASSYTPNYQLNQWAATDKVLREEFNQDNAKIDAALAAIQAAVIQEADQRQEAVEAVAATVPQIVTGTYTGNGAASRFIDLGFTPKAVYATVIWGATYSSAGFTYLGGLALDGAPVQINTYPILSVAFNGFMVYYATSPQSISTNKQNETYYYIAFT